MRGKRAGTKRSVLLIPGTRQSHQPSRCLPGGACLRNQRERRREARLRAHMTQPQQHGCASPSAALAVSCCRPPRRRTACMHEQLAAASGGVATGPSARAPRAPAAAALPPLLLQHSAPAHFLPALSNAFFVVRVRVLTLPRHDPSLTRFSILAPFRPSAALKRRLSSSSAQSRSASSVQQLCNCARACSNSKRSSTCHDRRGAADLQQQPTQ